MKKRAKELKGFILGLIVATVLTGTFVMANAEVRELIFGVSVSLNGQIIEFEDDMRPFVIQFADGGRTFLPVRAIADILGLDVDFSGATNTVLLTTTYQEPGTPGIPTAAGNRLADTTFHGTNLNSNNNNRTDVLSTASMVGAAHTNVTSYRTIHGNNAQETHHNLGGAYTRLTGLFGRADGSNGTRSATVTIIGDGTPIHTFDLLTGQMPISVDVDVTGVQLLVVQVRSFHNNDANSGSGNTQWIFSADLR